MIDRNGYRDPRAEELINIIIGCLADNDYEIVRMSDTDDYTTSAYDCILIKDWKWPGSIFTLHVSNKNNESYNSLFKKQSSVNLTEGE